MFRTKNLLGDATMVVLSVALLVCAYLSWERDWMSTLEVKAADSGYISG